MDNDNNKSEVFGRAFWAAFMAAREYYCRNATPPIPFSESDRSTLYKVWREAAGHLEGMQELPEKELVD